MITQTIQATIDLTTITVPYTYSFTSTNTCVSFSNQTGTSSTSNIITEVAYTTESCLEDNPVYLQVIGYNGCSISQQIQINNPCNNLSINLTQIGDYSFQATATSPNCGNVTIAWSFNDDLLSQASISNGRHSSTIDLTFNDLSSIRGRFPVSSSITATVTDCNGCEESSTLVFDICRPQVNNFVKHLQCYSNTVLGYTHSTGQFVIEEPTGCTSDINWSTLEFDLPSGFTLRSQLNTSPTRDAPSGSSYIITSTGVDPGTYTATYNVKDEHGVPSNNGVITLVVRSCGENNTITIPDRRINLDCGTVSPGDTIEINVENELITQTGTLVDWSTWVLVDPPTPQSPSIVLTTNVTGDHIIEYETNSPTILNDVFAWTVCDTNGNCAQASVYTVVECITGPTAVADSDCVSCDSSVIIDVLANDTSSGPIDVNTVEIESNPTNGTVDINSDGTITYTPNTGFEGADTFDYSVADTLGERSNSATVTVTVICAGEDTFKTICNS